METSRSKSYQNTIFKPGTLALTFLSISSEFKTPDNSATISADFRYGDDGTTTKDILLSDLELICDFSGHVKSVTFRFPSSEHKYDKDFFAFSSFQNGILLTMNSRTPERLSTALAIFEKELGLVEMPKIKFPKITDLEARLEILENKIIGLSTGLSCFLSYRFNSKSKGLALELTRFLSLLDVTVKSGFGYEPRKVTEKVLGRLKSGHDFFVYLIANDGESLWTRDELAVAFSDGVPVIILVEKGAEVGKGLLGDWEYIEFDPDHIGDTFIAVVEAINYVRGQGSR